MLLIVDPNSPEELARAHAAVDGLVILAQDVGGTCTGEHGVGHGKLAHLEREHGLPALLVRRGEDGRLGLITRAGQGALVSCSPPASFPPARTCAHSLSLMQAMHAVKQALDPHNIMNPGKLGSDPAGFAAAAHIDDDAPQQQGA